MPIVEVNGQGIEFPDSMSAGQIKDVLREKFPEPEIGMAQSALEGVKQGVTFGFGDELQSLAAGGTVGLANLLGRETGGLTAGQAYEQAMADYAIEREQAQQAHPITYGAGEIAGAIPTGVAGAERLGGQALATALQRTPLRAAAGLGGISGATYGFGTGEGGVEERLKQAGVSGVLGAGGGVIGSKIGGAVGRGITKLRAGKEVPESLTGKTLAEMSTQREAQDIARILPQSAENKAIDQVTKAIKKDFPDNWQEVLQAWKTGDKPLAELATPALRSKATGAAQYPSGRAGAEKYFTEQALSSPDRIKKAITENISSVDNYHTNAETLLKAGQKRAKPKYERAFETGKNINNERINQFLVMPELKQALQKGLTLQKIESVAEGGVFDPSAFAVVIDEAGEAVVKGSPNMRLLDSIKRGLDSMIKDQTDTVTGKVSDMGRALNGLKKSYVEELDRVNPFYKEARKSAGDYFQVSDAMRKGKDFMKADPELLKKTFSKLSEGEKDAFKIGIGKQIRDVLDKSYEGVNVYNRLFGSSAQKQRLASVLSPKEYINLEKSLSAENKLFKMRNEVIGGSPTSGKLQAAGEIAGEGAEMLANISSGGVKGAGVSVIRNALRKAFDGLSDNTAEAVSRLIYETDPQKKLLLLEKTLGGKTLSPQERRIIKEVYFKAESYMRSKSAGATAGAIFIQEGNK